MRAKSETLTEMCIFIHVRYPICIYQEDTSIVYINLRKLSLYPPTRYSIASYYNDEYRNHLYKPFLSCLFKTRFRISFLASGVTHKEAQLMDHRPSGNDRQYQCWSTGIIVSTLFSHSKIKYISLFYNKQFESSTKELRLLC